MLLISKSTRKQKLFIYISYKCFKSFCFSEKKVTGIDLDYYHEHLTFRRFNISTYMIFSLISIIFIFHDFNNQYIAYPLLLFVYNVYQHLNLQFIFTQLSTSFFHFID